MKNEHFLDYSKSPTYKPSSCKLSKMRMCPSTPAVVLYFSRYCTVRLNMFYFLCLFFMYYLCERCYKPITVQYYIADCVSWVPRLTLLDLQTCSQNGTHSYVGDLLYQHVRAEFHLSKGHSGSIRIVSLKMKQRGSYLRS